MNSRLVPNGKLREVIVTLLPKREATESPFGTYETEFDYDRLIIWIDHTLYDKLNKIGGISNIGMSNVAGRFLISIDPRYKTEWVIAEIEALAKLEEKT